MSATGARRIATDAIIERETGLPLSGGSISGVWGQKITDRERTYAILRTPVGHRVVFTFGHDIWDKGFTLEIEGAKEDVNKEFNKKVQAELRRLHVKKELNRMTVFERGYGWSILAISYLGTQDHAEEYNPTEDGYKDIVDLRAYGPTNITSVQEDKKSLSERHGFPKEYRVGQTGVSKRLRINWTRAIHVATRLLQHDWKGISMLDGLWNDLVALDNERWSMAQTLFRYGPGFPDITFTQTEKKKIQDWIDAGGMSNLFARAYFAHNDKSKLEFKGVSGVALDPMNYYLPIMESISLATKIPLAILRGVQAGALTGSEVNEREYQSLISEEQSMYEDSLIELIKAILRQPKMQAKQEGVKGAAEPTIPDFKIVWTSILELSEIEKVDLEIKKAQLLQTKGGWHTLNEIRALEDPKMDPLTDEQGGNQVLGHAPLKMPEGAQKFLVRERADGTHEVVEVPQKRKRNQKR